jgi:phosphoribosylaminoimidazole-succinocarboxamide synthase
MKNLVILSSGAGSNLNNIIKHVNNKFLFNCHISSIISNSDSTSLKIGINNKIPTQYLPWHKETQSREDYDSLLAKIILPFTPDIIVLSGWNHILTAKFLDHFKHIKVINLHPALINTFPGNNAIYDAWDAGQRNTETETGIMVHTVITELDVGEVIEELRIPINNTLPYNDFKTMMTYKEKPVLINAIEKLSTTITYRGKVKDVYKVDNKLLIVHTDRLSACNKYICEIPKKGYYLAHMANWWFDKTSDIVKNHKLGIDQNSLIVKKCKMIPFEFIVRGYICGSLWKHYSKGNRDYCGVQFEDGLTQFQQLPEFIITPTTKDDVDEPISYDGILEKNVISKDHLDSIYEMCNKLYVFGVYECKQKNLILVDTKYEFGYDEHGDIILVDEIHTIESSRYWIQDTYLKCIHNNQEPQKIDKDIIRKYVNNNEQVPTSVQEQYMGLYRDFYHRISGNELDALPTPDVDIASIYNTFYNSSEDYNIVIVSGSESDYKHVNKLKSSLDTFKLKYKSYACSAHKNTKGVLNILETNKDRCKIYITVAGKSNALSGVIASNSSVPVISCPPFKDDVDMMTNLQSSIQCPSNCPVMTILSPMNVAISCNRMLQL